AADSTIEHTSFYTEQVFHSMMSEPETRQTFQLTNPDSGFGGMVLKPWSERNRSVAQVSQSLQRKLASIPGIRTFASMPAALPGGSDFPLEFIIAGTE